MWIDEAAAARAVELALSEQDFPDEPTAHAVKDGRPVRPMLVERLDNTKSAYYLVPWETPRGTELVVRMDASNGEFLGLSKLAQPRTSALISADDAVREARVMLPDIELSSPRGVWRPCRQSTTPYRPFFEILYEGGALYVDMDCTIHHGLLPLGRGGAQG